jgi:hypothetical protein
MFGFLAPEDPNLTRRLVFAGFYYFIGVVILVTSMRARWRVKWKGGADSSIASQAALLLLFSVWGTTSVGVAFGWTFVVVHELVLRLVPMGLVAACFGIDLLRHSRSRLRR